MAYNIFDDNVNDNKEWDIQYENHINEVGKDFRENIRLPYIQKNNMKTI